MGLEILISSPIFCGTTRNPNPLTCPALLPSCLDKRSVTYATKEVSQMLQHLYQRACHRISYAATRDAGFTVIEAIVAMTIFVIVSAAAIAAVFGGIQSSNNTNNRVGAANIAQSDLEQARAQGTPSATSYPTAPTSGGPTFQVTRSVTMPPPSATATCPDGSSIKVGVTVSGPGNSGRSVSMSTVIAC
jgi:prepilin-type N-terminal cleavage/methylation domain-containing protein